MDSNEYQKGNQGNKIQGLSSYRSIVFAAALADVHWIARTNRPVTPDVLKKFFLNAVLIYKGPNAANNNKKIMGEILHMCVWRISGVKPY